MTGAEQARETDYKEASTKLNEGLETCRVVVETYRELLGDGSKQESRSGESEAAR